MQNVHLAPGKAIGYVENGDRNLSTTQQIMDSDNVLIMMNTDTYGANGTWLHEDGLS